MYWILEKAIIFLLTWLRRKHLYSYYHRYWWCQSRNLSISKVPAHFTNKSALHLNTELRIQVLWAKIIMKMCSVSDTFELWWNELFSNDKFCSQVIHIGTSSHNSKDNIQLTPFLNSAKGYIGNPPQRKISEPIKPFY